MKCNALRRDSREPNGTPPLRLEGAGGVDKLCGGVDQSCCSMDQSCQTGFVIT